MTDRGDLDPRIAWVESPLQLLNAVEYGAAHTERLEIIPRAGLAQMDATVRAVTPALPPGVLIAPAQASATRSRFARAQRQLIGDPFSGQFRAVASVGRLADLVMVDDGNITLALMRQLADGVALARPGVAEGRSSRALGKSASRAIRSAAAKGRVALFTAYGDAVRAACHDSGVTLVANAYAWARTAELTEVPGAAGRIVLGSALADDGLVDAVAYRAWVEGLAVESPVTYYPHRRERAESVSAIRALPQVSVAQPGLPIELVVAASRDLQDVHTLPSSVVATLRAITRGAVPIKVTKVETKWWTPAADDTLRQTLDTVSADRSDHA